MIYLIVLIALIVCCYIYDFRGATKQKWFWYFAIMVSLILIAGLRYRLGSDTFFYLEDLKKAHGITDLSGVDFARSRYAPLWVVFNSLCKTVSPDMAVLQTAQAIIVNVAFFLFIKKNTRHVFLGVTLYYFFLYFLLNMEVMREAICVSLLLFSWPFFRDGKWLIYYIFAVVAFFVHVSATVLLLLPLCCLPWVRDLFVFGKRTIFVFLGTLVVAFLIQKYLFVFIQTIAFTDSMMDRATTYSKNDLGVEGVNLNGLIGLMFRYALYPVMALYFIHRNRKRRGEYTEDRATRRFEMMVVLSLCVTAFSSGIYIFQRFNNYFLMFALIVVANWAYSPFVRKSGRKLRLNYVYWTLILVPWLVIQSYFFLFQGVGEAGRFQGYMRFYPYNSVLNPEENQQRENFVLFLNRRKK